MHSRRRQGWRLPSTYHNGLSDFLGLDSIAYTTEVVIESTLKTGHELDTGLVTGVDGFDGFSQIGGQRLFAKDVLAIGSGSLDLFGVVLGRRANPNGINLRIGDDFHGIVGETRDVELGGGW